MDLKLPMFLAPALLLTACVHHESTVVRDVPRVKVEFENEAAARVFFDTLDRATASTSESKTEIGIPFIFNTTRHTVSGPNGAFNHAVDLCDLNGDQFITELEAKIFSDRSRGRK